VEGEATVYYGADEGKKRKNTEFNQGKYYFLLFMVRSAGDRSETIVSTISPGRWTRMDKESHDVIEGLFPPSPKYTSSAPTCCLYTISNLEQDRRKMVKKRQEKN
jgi:hypothetical protein